MSKLITKIRNNLNRKGLEKVPTFLAIRFSRLVFKFFEKYLKLHITPVHFYSPIPNTYELGPEVFDKIYDCSGIEWNISGQKANLETFHAKYYNEYKPKVNIARLSQVDSFILYSFIRERKPAKMIEIGTGESTMVSLAALEMNAKEGNGCEFHAIEPYPEKFIRDIRNPGFTLISKKLQEVDIDLFTSADLLFIDSSHVSRIGSDVNYEILEILPRLNAGTLIHWHDIVIPTNYWKKWIDNGNQFWNESYMVHAFMLFNRAFRVSWASRYLQIHYPGELKERFSYFNSDDDNQQITSFWVEKVL